MSARKKEDEFLSVPNHEFYCICNLGIKKIFT